MGWSELRVELSGEIVGQTEGGGKKMMSSKSLKDWSAKVYFSKSDMAEILGGSTFTNNTANYLYTGAPNTTSPNPPVWTTIATDNTDTQPWVDYGIDYGNEIVIGPGTIPVVYDDPPIQNPPGTLSWISPGIEVFAPAECDHDDLVEDMVEMQEQWIGAIEALRKKAEDLAKCVEMLFNQVESDKLSQSELDDLATVARIKALEILGAKLTKDQGVKLIDAVIT